MVEQDRQERRKARVLIIEDEDEIRELLRMLVTFWGHEVEVAPNAEEGLDLFDQSPYDLVLTDLSMPGMTGRDVIEHVRRRRPPPGVIMITGSATRLDDEWAHEREIMLVRKPFVHAELRRAVDQVLNSHAS
jgi:CheY-like chemotaxis protein